MSIPPPRFPRRTAAPRSTAEPVAAGEGARIVAYVEHRVKAVVVHDDALMLIKHGRKSLITPGGRLDVDRGHGLLLAAGTSWDVVNDPLGQGRYEALFLAFAPALVQELRPDAGVAAPALVHDARVLPPDEALAEAAERAASFLKARAVSPTVRRHRLMEVLLLLAERGHVFAPRQSLGWGERVRRLVAQRPDADWTEDALGAAFNASASTLRRRLDEDQAPPLATLVREVRLEIALGLLQTTRLPVGEVAQRCGWTSHSRFTAAFQERWGFAPSLLRSGGLTAGAQRAVPPG